MFRKGPFIIFRLIGLLLVIGLIVGGGAMAYRAGIAQGISQAPAVATAISKAAESGQVAPVPPMMYGYGYPMYARHHFGFFPLGGICLSIFFLFFFFGFLKMIFFRGMRHGDHHMRGPWGKGWEGGAPSMFNEWHKRAHDEKPAEDGDKKE
jgi:hypothetical protein